MDIKTLYEILEINEGEELEYFEDVANLFESDEIIDSDVICQLLKSIDLNGFSNIVKNYFDDLTEAIPGDAVELFTLLSNIGNSIIGMALNCQEPKTYVLLAEEIFKFRQWYTIDSHVYCTNLSNNTGEFLSLRDGLVLARIENLGGEKYDYNFEDFLKYPIEEYIMSFKDLVNYEMDE